MIDFSSYKVGDYVFYQGSCGRIIQQRGGEVTVEFEEGMVWYNTTPEKFFAKQVVIAESTKNNAVVFPQVETPYNYEADRLTSSKETEPRIADVTPLEISTDLFSYLFSLPVRIRIFWQDHIDQAVRDMFAKQSVPLPVDIRALQFGINGGVTKQGGVCAVIRFQIPDDQSVWSDFVSLGLKHKIENGIVTCNNKGFALGLIKLGCKITEYAK